MTRTPGDRYSNSGGCLVFFFTFFTVVKLLNEFMSFGVSVGSVNVRGGGVSVMGVLCGVIIGTEIRTFEEITSFLGKPATAVFFGKMDGHTPVALFGGGGGGGGRCLSE